jgi:hypothetical protein
MRQLFLRIKSVVVYVNIVCASSVRVLSLYCRTSPKTETVKHYFSTKFKLYRQSQEQTPGSSPTL